jgi:hypothetical protein
MRSFLRSVQLLIILVAPGVVDAQVPLLPDEVERVDVIAIEIDGRDVYAFDALTGRNSTLRLEVAERIVFEKSRGRVGIVLTDRRVLGVAAGSGWSELRLGIQEEVPSTVLVEDRIAVLASNRRALAFTGSGGWLSEGLSPGESTTSIRVGAAVGLITTNRRALGAAPGSGRFVVKDLQVREVLESVGTQDTLATLRTDRRILVFSAPRALWSEKKRKIN